MKITKLMALWFLLHIVSAGTASDSQIDDSWKVFDDTSVGEVKILIDPAYLDFIFDPSHAESDSLFPATLIFKNAVIPGDTLRNIGFRTRGNTSRYSAKKSFKIDINHFVPGRQFYDLEKLNLNGEHNDPSIIRSKLCWDLFQRIGVPASRANHVKLTINNRYMGLYIHVEHIDDEFVQKRFGNQNGNLYKCLYPADLVYLGADQPPYQEFFGDRRVYDLMTNKAKNDYSDLVHFIDVLNNTPQPSLKSELEQIFHVENFLKWLALNVLVGSWDDYWYLKNNYYLYHNTATDQFEFIPYDYDNTYGVDWVGGDWGTRNIYNWGNATDPRPLVTRILSVPEYRNRYTQYLVDFMDHEFAFATQQPRIDQIKTMITPAAEADSFRTLDWDFSIDDFHRSYTNSIATQNNHVPYGLKPYIQTRIATARSQISYINLPPTIRLVQHDPLYPEPNQPVNITADVADNERVTSVRLYYRTAGANFLSQLMFDDGNHVDGNANDGRYGSQIPPHADGSVIYYFVEAQDNQLSSTKSPVHAPDNAFGYVSRQASASDVLVSFHFKKALLPDNVGVGVLGSFNNWDKIFPMKEIDSYLWQVSCYLPQGNYIYKFVTYKNQNGQAGVTEWIADPENPKRDGPPYFNAVLSVTDPMVYYIKPLSQDTLFTNRPEISAAFASSRNTTIDPASLIVGIDEQPIDDAGSYFDPSSSEFHYLPSTVLARGEHSVSFLVKNSLGHAIVETSEFFVSAPLLVINEFMAANTMIHDEFGQADDWIEIYNADAEAIDLNGMFLSDDLTRPQRWMLPDMSLQPGEFLLIWADGEPNQGAFHTNFKLSAGGEQIGLFASLALGNAPIDTLSFGPQTANVSYGRYPDASNHYEFMPPTPKQVNATFTGISISKNSAPDKFELWQNYPNPFNPETQIKIALPKSEKVTLNIYNIAGQKIKTLADQHLSAGCHCFSWDGTDELGTKVRSGAYLYRVKTVSYQTTRKMVLIY